MLQYSVFRGLLWMLLSTVGFSISHLIVRYLGDEIHSSQTVFFRGFFGLIVVSPWIIRHGFSLFKTSQLKLHFVRAAFSFSSVSCFYYALTKVPLAKVTAIGFIAPILSSVLAVLFLKETARSIHWVALLIGLAGTMLILQPGVIPLNFGVLMMLISTVLFAVNLLVIKVLGRYDSSIAITAYISVMMLPLSLPIAIAVWVWPTFEQFLLLTLMGFLNAGSLIAFTQAMKEAPTPVVMPLDFLRLIWMALFGYFLYLEIPDTFTWIGGVLIFGGAFMVAMAERPKRPIYRT